MAAAAQDVVASVHYREAVVRTLCQQTSRAPTPVIISAAFVAWIAWTQNLSGAAIGGWFTLLSMTLILRWVYARRVLRRTVDVNSDLNALLAFNLCNGTLAGAAALLFMPSLELEWKAILTMIIMAWGSGSVTLSGAWLPSFLCFTIPMAVLLSCAWFVSAEESFGVDAGVGALILLFFIVQFTFARQSERIFRESFDMRYEKERLVEALEVERANVTQQRDRAERLVEQLEVERANVVEQRDHAERLVEQLEIERANVTAQRDLAHQANKKKSSLLAAASHDLRQPLNVINVHSASLSLHEETAQASEDISKSVEQMRALLDSLIEIARLDAGEIAPKTVVFDAVALLRSVVREFRDVAAAKGLALELDAPEPAYICSDESLLERIVKNLVDNALKYTRKGRVRVVARVDAAQVKLSVIDTGIGIPERDQKYIFDEFYQLDNAARDLARGFGMGLAIVRRHAELLGTPLTLHSREGEGSTFSLTLPCVAPPTAALGGAQKTLQRELSSLEGVHVLVVDDEPTTLGSMRALLEALRCRVSTAQTADEALRACERDRPDALVTDYRLRESENGLDLIRMVRDRHGSIPAIVVTGEAIGGGGDGECDGIPLLSKPVDTLKLVTYLKEKT